MGVPVIVTDPAGREPMILLPLEQFEAMAGESPVRRESGVGRRKEDAETQFSAPERSIPLNVAESSESGIPLEDRFYLEPTDDQPDI